MVLMNGSVERIRYSADLSINLSSHLDRRYQFFYTYINPSLVSMMLKTKKDIFWRRYIYLYVYIYKLE